MASRTAKLSPTTFRNMLICAIGLLLALGVAGFYWVQSNLSTYAEEISTKVAEAESSKNSVEQLKLLEKELEELSEVRSRTELIVAQSQSYRYQDKIIADINRYAAQAGISISQISFQEDAAAPGSPAPANPSPQPGTAAAPTPVAGVKSTLVNISLAPPIEYRNLLTFMRSIERNLTKMQISGITLTPGDSRNTVSTDALSIEVYIK